MRLTPAQKMMEILREKFKVRVPFDSKIERTRAGYWQRSAGAWSWFLIAEGVHTQIGSQSPIGELLRCPNLVGGSDYPGQLAIDCGCKGRCRGIKTKEAK